MQQTLPYLTQCAQWWEELQGFCGGSQAFQEGLAAYTFKHAWIYWELAEKWQAQWAPLIAWAS